MSETSTTASPSTAEPTQLRRAVVLMTASSVLIPAAGLLTQPLLARTLGAVGRGELMAAQAPAVLLGSVATLGLPDALTYLAARSPQHTRRGIGWAALLSVAMGALCVLLTLVLAPVLAAGDPELADLILLSMALVVPVLVVGAVRGAARGHQEWNAIAVESVVSTALRVGGYVVLWLLGDLTVLSALLVTSIAPVLGAVVYLPVLRRTASRRSEHRDAPPDRVFVPLLQYGGRVWFGSVASMLLARIGQVLMVPLSSVRDLGLYTVASTISDVPLVVSMSVSGALQGVNSRSNDPAQVTATTRLTLLVSFVGCAAIAAVTPFAIVPLFGPEFSDALVPTLLLLASAVICVPGLMAGAGLAAFGRPGLRSLGLATTFVANLVTFVLLVPPLGVMGACWTSVVSNVVLSGFSIGAASRVMGRPVADFVVVRRADVVFAWHQGWALSRRVLRRPPRNSTQPDEKPQT